MLRAVGRHADGLDVEPEAAEQRRRDRAGGAVGAVDDDRERRASGAGVGEHPAQVRRGSAGRDRAAGRAGASDAGDLPTTLSATIASTARSSASVNFSPAPENTLMPLSR